MKINRGFTLIELLAVIIVLAIILIISVPKINNIIVKSKKNTLISSVKLITKSIKADSELNNEFTYKLDANGTFKNSSNKELKYSGKLMPLETEVNLSINDLGKISIDSAICDKNKEYCVMKTGDLLSINILSVFSVSTNKEEEEEENIVPSSNVVSVLVVGGGGGGGNDIGGGGAAGGVIYEKEYILESESEVTVYVGLGGKANYIGGDSSFSTLIARGGGAGGFYNRKPATTGGSGGGAAGNYSTSSVMTGAKALTLNPMQGNDGGSGARNASGGGGGGAGGKGSDAETLIGGSGGAGVLYDISGIPTWYAAGGGGCATSTEGSVAGLGGSGIGGNGVRRGEKSFATAGKANTGSGGGGHGFTQNYISGGQGGSGIVIISYLTGSKKAYGGIITHTDSNNENPRSGDAYPNGYTIHTFLESGAFVLDKSNNEIVDLKQRVLIVGGGGGASVDRSGGAGGGGVVFQEINLPNAPLSYPVVVGEGGKGAAGRFRGNNGEDSVFNQITAFGGGGSGAGAGVVEGKEGGSGGGAGNKTPSRTYLGGLGTEDQGFNGGSGIYAPPNYGAGGGGGAGGPGENGTKSSSGNGGIGSICTISGNIIYYGGGGGAGSYGGGKSGFGGFGGGGLGGTTTASNGTPNTGGGAGSIGNPTNGIGRSGGSGIVIISYPTGTLNAKGGNITYTDKYNSWPRSDKPYNGGFTIHTFLSSDTFVIE